MIRAIANKKLDLNQDEYEYYLELEKAFGAQAFIGLFATNDSGQITSVIPATNTPTAMVLIFFFLNVMFNQRLRKLEVWMDRLERVEEKVDELLKVNNG